MQIVRAKRRMATHKNAASQKSIERRRCFVLPSKSYSIDCCTAGKQDGARNCLLNTNPKRMTKLDDSLSPGRPFRRTQTGQRHSRSFRALFIHIDIGPWSVYWWKEKPLHRLVKSALSILKASRMPSFWNVPDQIHLIRGLKRKKAPFRHRSVFEIQLFHCVASRWASCSEKSYLNFSA